MLSQTPVDRWYYAQGKKKVGPVALAQLRRLLAEGVLKSEDMVFLEGTARWRPLAEVTGAEMPRVPSDLWYYIQAKKKVGPVSLAQLDRLLAEGVLKPADMVFQEGTTKWRPLGELADREIVTAYLSGRWKLVLGGSAALVLVALFGWVLSAILHRSNGNQAVENPGLAAETLQTPDAAEETIKGAAERLPGGEETPPPTSERPTLLVQLGHSVHSVAFSPDGKRVLTGSADGTRMWDVTSGIEIRSFPDSFLYVQGRPPGFSPDGKQVYAGGKLWDSASGKEIRNFNSSYQDRVICDAYSPDRKHVLSNNYATVQLWDLSCEKKILDFPETNVISLALSPDGTRIVTGTGNGYVRTWDAANGRQIRSFSYDTADRPGRIPGAHASNVESVAFSPDGRQILTAGRDGACRLWDTANGNIIHTFRGRVLRMYDLQVGQYRDYPGGAAPAIFSPDGKQILAAGVDLKLWDAVSGKEVRAWVNITGEAVAFSPDGKQVLTAVKGVGLLFDVASGRELRKFQGHAGPVSSVAFSPDGKQLLSGGTKKAALWDAVNCKLLREFPTNQQITQIVFSPDGKQILAATKDVHARLWDAASGKEIRNLTARQARTAPIRLSPPRITAVAFSQDGKQILAGTQDGTARLWDAASARETRSFPHGSSFCEVAFALTGGAGSSPNGEQVFTGATSWDVATGNKVRTFGAELCLGINALCMAFSPDGKEILTASDDGIARLWDTANGKEIRSFHGHTVPVQASQILRAREYIARVSAVAFSPDGKQVVTASEGATWLWDKTTGEEIRAFKRRDLKRVAASRAPALIDFCPTPSVVFSPDGKQLCTGNSFGGVSLWDAGTGEELRTFHRAGAVQGSGAHTGSVRSIVFSRNSAELLTAGAEGIVRVWEVSSGKELHNFAYPGPSAVFSPDGKQLFTGGSMRDMATGKEIHLIQGHSALVHSVAFSPDGKRALTGSSDSAELWDAASGTKLHTLHHHGGVYSVAFSPDTKQLLTGCDDGVARLWDAASGKLTLSFNWYTSAPGAKTPSGFRHGGWVAPQRVAVSPDGKQVLTANVVAVNAGRLRLWDAVSGKQIREFDMTQRASPVSHMVFSHDSKYVLTCTFKTAELWDAATGRVIRTFSGHTGAVTSAVFSPDSKQVLTGSGDGTARLWDAASGRELCRLVNFLDGSWVAATLDQYYMGSKWALPGIAFRIGNRAFPFDQFDLKFNRPDKVLESIGMASPEIVAAYRHAYQKRLKRLKFTEDMLSDDFHVPEIAVHADAAFSTREKTLKMNIKASDSKYLLERVHIDVNGVPLHGTSGISLRKQASKSWQQAVEVELSSGKNKIDVSVLNTKGAESLKESFSINRDAPSGKPDLYVVVVGISDYQDARFRLTYADKDARDLAELFNSKREHYGEVKLLSLLNRDATRENILQAREFLKASQVNDLVVIFFAGHGLLDNKLDYYFGTADIDFTDPAKRGLPYEAIEDLLDGIRARKKLLLMDTCHSGELDKEEIQIVQSQKQPEGEIKTRSFRGGLTRVSSKVGLNNSYQLLQETFADLRRGTGAVVIASAGGTEYAVESQAWKNGVFTYALLRGLKGEVKRDASGRVQVSQLRDFVEQEVRRLTAGKQSPTARRENLEFDFAID